MPRMDRFQTSELSWNCYGESSYLCREGWVGDEEGGVYGGLRRRTERIREEEVTG